MGGTAYRGLVVVVALLSACLRGLSYECATDAACVLDDEQGVCLAPGHCAYPEAECDSGLRFGPAAGQGLASQCVDGAPTTTGALESTSTTSPAECGPCESTPMECRSGEVLCVDGACVQPPLDAGIPCREADPCVIDAACDGAGACVVAEGIECADPPGPCHMPVGVCGTDGTCSYALRTIGTPCEDGDGCTLEDACDGRGACVPGPICPTDNPCAAGSCGGAQCTFFPVVDGLSCGPMPRDVCCAGACVDLTADTEHCGSCDVACGPTESCVAMGEGGTCTPV